MSRTLVLQCSGPGNCLEVMSEKKDTIEEKDRGKVITVGLTGGIGSGKSTVAELWENNGAVLFKSDFEGKRILMYDPDAKEEVVELFGKEAYGEDDSLNRHHIASIAFQDSSMLQKLNAIVHPRVRANFEHKARSLAELDQKIVLVNEAALIFESGIQDAFDHVVLVWSPEEIRLERVVARDKATPEEVRGRMMNQLRQDDLKDRSDYMIENTGSLFDLARRAGEVWEELRS